MSDLGRSRVQRVTTCVSHCHPAGTNWTSSNDLRGLVGGWGGSQTSLPGRKCNQKLRQSKVLKVVVETEFLEVFDFRDLLWKGQD